MKKRYFVLIITGIAILVFVFFWKDFYALRIFKSGKVQQKEFFVEKIPFERIMGLPVIKVKIGEEYYKFLYDTGAVNLISTVIAKKHLIKEINKIEIYDSQGSSDEMSIGKVDSISIGGINFLNFGTLISNEEKIKISCLEVDGIIGANLMRKVIWLLNFEKNEISISNNKDKFQLNNYKSIPFSKNNQGTPVIEVEIDSISKYRPILDTGYNGKILLDYNNFNKTLHENNLNVVEVIGAGSKGLLLKKKSDRISSSLIKFSKIRVGKDFFENQVIEFSNINKSGLIGNEFLKKFNIILDWKNSRLYYKKIETIKSEFKNYGFYWGYSENKVVVTDILMGTKASKFLEIGDQLVNINEHNLHEITKSQWCDIRRTSTNSDSIRIKIRRKDTLIDYVFQRKNIFK